MGIDRRPNVYGISRDLWEHPAFPDEPFTERQAWAWMIGAAAWKEISARGNSGQVTLRRGELSFSVRFLAERWQWSKSAVDRFLMKLEKRDMMRDTSRDGSKIYFLVNYNTFQVVGLPKQDSDRDSSGTAAGQQRDKEETGKQLNIKQTKKVGAGAPRLAFETSFPSWWPVPEWQAFCEMRKKKRAPLTERAVALIVADLTRYRANGQSPAAILDQSTRKCWTDVYALKGAPAIPTEQSAADEVETWATRLEWFHFGRAADDFDDGVKPGYWETKWGPMPGAEACRVPDAAAKEFARRHPVRAVK